MPISLCMIVKNEEDNLARCLESVKGIADEIIVTDTGSTDRTVSIARSYGAKIYRYRWNDSFADARNDSLSKATGTWILIMDADDELEPDDKSALLRLAREEEGGPDVYCCRTLCYSGPAADPCNMMVTRSIRLIRNGKGYRYRGRVHEQLTGGAEPPAVAAADVRFHHYGYLSDQIEKKKKHQRNIALIRKELEETPGSGFMLFNLGNEYLALGRAEQAMDCYRKSYRAAEFFQGYGSMLLTRMILCCEQLCREDDLFRYLGDGLRLYPHLTDFEYLKAAALERRGKILKALRSYQRCVRMGKSPLNSECIYGVSTFKPHCRLAVLYERLGEPELALRHCRRAVRLNPGCRKICAQAVALLANAGCSPRQISSRMLRLTGGFRDPESLLMLSDLLYDRGMYPEAMRLAVRAKGLASDGAACRGEARYREGVCRFYLGQYRRAYQCLQNETDSAPERTSRRAFFRFLCLLLDPTGVRPRPENFQAELEPPYCRTAALFQTLLNGTPGVSVPAGQSGSPEEEDALFSLLELLLRAGRLGEFLLFVPSLNRATDCGTLLRLGKLYYKYGYGKLACHEFFRSIQLTGKIDAESLAMLQKPPDSKKG